MIKRFLTAAVVLAALSSAHAQQLQPGEMLANPTAARAPPAPSTLAAYFARAAGTTAGRILCITGGVWQACNAPTLGVPGASAGSIALAGSGSGTATITTQAAAGTPTLLLPTGSGTLASAASSPLSLSATTGALTCPTCVTTADTIPVNRGGTGQTTAAAARGPSGLNIDQMSTTGDADVSIAATTRTQATTATLTAPRTWTLPAANAVNAGQTVTVTDKFGGINGVNTITVARAGADTINGASSIALAAQYGTVTVISDGVSRWSYPSSAGGGGTVTAVTAGSGLAGGTVNVSGTISSYFEGDSLTNCSISATVSGNALTAAIVDRNGSTPSASSPCSIAFRNTTLTNGTYSTVDVTAATTFSTGTSGSTFGVANNVPFRLWLVAINNAGTVVLGVTNRATATFIAGLNEAQLMSTTACSACTTANAAQTVYSTAAQTNRAMRVLGYVDFDSGQVTAGVWASSPTRVHLRNSATPLPGQPTGNYGYGSTTTPTNLAGAGDVAYSATALTASITPAAAPNRVSVSWRGGFVTNGVSKWAKLITTRGGSNIGFSTNNIFSSATIISTPGAGDLMDAPGSSGAVTYGVSIACEVGTTCTFPYTGSGGDTGGNMMLAEIQG